MPPYNPLTARRRVIGRPRAHAWRPRHPSRYRAARARIFEVTTASPHRRTQRPRARFGRVGVRTVRALPAVRAASNCSRLAAAHIAACWSPGCGVLSKLDDTVIRNPLPESFVALGKQRPHCDGHSAGGWTKWTNFIAWRHRLEKKIRDKNRYYSFFLSTAP